MNVIFHTTSALGIIAMLTDTERTNNSVGHKMAVCSLAFLTGVISHGALDYIPHCYPFAAKLDVILGFFMICVFVFKSKPQYRPMVALSFLGSIFPDIVDLSPQILNKYFNIGLPIFDKVFPWHWEKYSGSIFIDDCNTSALNHSLLIIVIAIVCYKRRRDLKNIFL